MTSFVDDVSYASLFGYQQHTVDVMRVLAIIGVNHADLMKTTLTIVGANAVSLYYNALDYKPIQPRGLSDKNVAQAFRAAYKCQFRYDYLRWLLQVKGVPLDQLKNFSPGVIDDIPQHGQLRIENTQSLDCPTGNVSEYALCTVCGFNVKVEGHINRCRIQPHNVVSNEQVKLAWIGDAIHVLDIRILLLASSVESKNLQFMAESFISRTAQKEYLLSVGVSLPSTSTNHDWSTVFESMYHGEFREIYLEWVKRKLSATNITVRQFMLSDIGSMVISFCQFVVLKFAG